MDAINKALTDLYFSVPSEILQLGFNDNPLYATQSLDETILTRLIRPKILVDCNLVGGIEVYISIHQCTVSDYSNNYLLEYLIDVPKIITGNKSIISALGLFDVSNNITSGTGTGELSSELARQVSSVSSDQAIATTKLELVGENKVLVTDPVAVFLTGVLKCVVTNDVNLSNISPRSYPALSQLVVLGVKAYIYNHMIVKLGKGYIHNGHELGIVNDIIAEYSSANEDYRLYLQEVWAKVAFHNDKDRLSNHIAGMF